MKCFSEIYYKSTACNATVTSNGVVANFSVQIGASENVQVEEGAIVAGSKFWSKLPPTELKCGYNATLEERVIIEIALSYFIY